MIYVAGEHGFLGRQLVACGAQPFRSHVVKESDVVINCVAKTNHEYCERFPKLAWDSNVDFLASLFGLDCNLIHVSTDYVFNGSQIFSHLASDPISPVNSVYARTKAASEILFTTHAEVGRHVMVRTAWLFGPGRPAWFDFPKLWNQVGSATYTKDLASVLYKIAFRIEMLENPDELILQYATTTRTTREAVAYLAGNRSYELVQTPKDKPRYTVLETSPWILAFHRRPTLQECINDFRKQSANTFENAISDVQR